MRKSVSRVIDRDNGNLLAIVNKQEESIGAWEIEKAFGKVPKHKYRVTYTLSEKGKYLVEGDYDMPGLHCPGDHTSGMGVCWLPREWGGYRVNRKVEILPKRRRK
jgi:hypothetical protein